MSLTRLYVAFVIDHHTRHVHLPGVTTAPQAPRMNVIAERFVRTAQAECTNRMLITGERHARIIMA